MSEEKDTSKKRSWRDRFGRVQGLTKMTPGRRRLLIIVGIVALVITIVAIVPGYIATQPKFMQRYTNLSPDYHTWSKSVHSRVSCQRCHVSPRFTAQAVFNTRMVGEFYLSFLAPNRKPALLSQPTDAACSSCHIDMRTVSPSGDLNIPHRAHVTVLKLECIKCHSYLVHSASPEGKHTPTMAGCLKCHDGRQAKSACSTCHKNKGIPENHRAADWGITHPTMQKQVDCTKCHAWTANWCAECHTHRPKSHTTNWRSKHGAAVGKHRNCEACHQAAFCDRCHGEVPALNLNPALTFVK